MTCPTFPAATRHPDGFYEIGPEQTLPAGAQLVDVREPAEYAELAPHATAQLVPLAQLTARATEWDRATPLVLACRSGARSGRAATALAQLGFRCVVSLRGGMRAYWQRGH